jgi:hypothetical protein
MFQSMQVRCLVGTGWVQERAVEFKRNGWFLKDACGIFCAMCVQVRLKKKHVFAICTTAVR